MNYLDTFIAVADDCPVATAVVPQAKSDKKPVAVIQYEMLADHPYEYTQEDVLFQTFARHKDIPPAELAAHERELREQFFARPQPCLRTSPLARRYGWGFHFDPEGKVTLCPLGSPQYDDLAQRAPTVLKALRTKRA